MRSKLNYAIKAVEDVIKLRSSDKESVPVVYFDRVANVGDLLNKFLIERITGKKVYRIHSNVTSHLLAIGSIIHLADTRSIIWGSGVIDPEWLPSKKVLGSIRIHALRGELSKELLLSKGLDIEDIELGDPALLMPKFYQPVSVKKKYRLGVVPHFIDQESESLKHVLENSGGKLIDVKKGPEQFIEELVQCEMIISSSMHGLILSDAYGIPNQWVRFSDRIIGGEYKYFDYYSTTDIDRPSCVSLISESQTRKLNIKFDSMRVNHYKFGLDNLLNSFPTRL
jgi:pyruvyltransferase